MQIHSPRFHSAANEVAQAGRPCLLSELCIFTQARKTMSMQQLQHMLTELQDRVQRFLCFLIRACYAQVRDVPLGEFRSKYSGDVNAMLMDSINQRLQATKVTIHPAAFYDGTLSTS